MKFTFTIYFKLIYQSCMWNMGFKLQKWVTETTGKHKAIITFPIGTTLKSYIAIAQGSMPNFFFITAPKCPIFCVTFTNKTFYVNS